MRRTLLEEHERVTQSGQEETTVGVFREIWLADCADRLAPRTVHSYRRILQLEALAPLLPMELHEVTARKLAPVISRVTAEHGRPSGLAAFRSLSAMFGLAERWGYIEMNPFRRMQAPTVPKREPTVPTPIVMERAMRIATPEFASVLQFAICTGCRRGEVAGLRWGDLDTEIVTKKFGIIPLIVDKFVFVHGSNVVGAVVNGTYTGYYDLATVSVKS